MDSLQCFFYHWYSLSPLLILATTKSLPKTTAQTLCSSWPMILAILISAVMAVKYKHQTWIISQQMDYVTGSFITHHAAALQELLYLQGFIITVQGSGK